MIHHGPRAAGTGSGGRCARLRSDRGSAVIEFIVIAVLVLVPMCYVVLSVMRVQAATFASTQAVREAGRAFSMADTPDAGFAAARMAARLAFEDQGFEDPGEHMRIACAPSACLAPGSTVQVRLDWQVPLPWLPASLATGRAAAVPISARHESAVDVYRASG